MFITGSPPAFRCSAVMLFVSGDLLFLSFSIAALLHLLELAALYHNDVVIPYSGSIWTS